MLKIAIQRQHSQNFCEDTTYNYSCCFLSNIGTWHYSFIHHGCISTWLVNPSPSPQGGCWSTVASTEVSDSSKLWTCSHNSQKLNRTIQMILNILTSHKCCTCDSSASKRCVCALWAPEQSISLIINIIKWNKFKCLQYFENYVYILYND